MQLSKVEMFETVSGVTLPVITQFLTHSHHRLSYLTHIISGIAYASMLPGFATRLADALLVQTRRKMSTYDRRPSKLF
jgi:hypothetical protein